MPRLPRVHVQQRPLMELGNRVVQGFSLLSPDDGLNRLVIGVLAKAQARYPMPIHAGAILSNHWHLLASPVDVKQQADFLGFFTRCLSRIVGRRHGWQGPMFAERYRSTEISAEAPAQEARLKYVLANGCKEGLVASPLDWPGVNFAAALANGSTLKGIWIDRDAYRAAQARGESVSESDFAEPVELKLSPLPCWAHLSSRRYRAAVTDVIREIEQETAAMHRRRGTLPLGPEQVRQQDPWRPRQLERRPCLWVYGRSLEAVKTLLQGLKTVVVAYRAAADLLRTGSRNVRFPQNCFPPALPFVPYGSAFSGVPGKRVGIPPDAHGSPPGG